MSRNSFASILVGFGKIRVGSFVLYLVAIGPRYTIPVGQVVLMSSSMCGAQSSISAFTGARSNVAQHTRYVIV